MMRVAGLRSLYVATFLVMTAQGIVIPLLPTLVRQTGAASSVAMVGVVVAAFGLARLAAGVPAGRLAGAVGVRALMTLGPILMSVSLVALAAAETVESMALARTISGVSSAFFLTASLLFLSSAVPGEVRGRAYGYFYAAFAAGISAGPALGGLLAERDVVGALLLGSGSSALGGLVTFSRIPHSAPADESGAGALPGPRATRGWIVLMGSLSLVAFATRNGTQQTIVPTAVTEAGLPLSVVGLGFTAAALATAIAGPIAGRLLDTRDRRLVLALSLATLGITIQGWSLGSSEGVFLGTMIAYGLVSAVVDTATLTNLTDPLTEAERPRVIGYFRTFSDGGYILGPLMLAAVAAATAPSVAVAVNGAALVLAAAVAALSMARLSPFRGVRRS